MPRFAGSLAFALGALGVAPTPGPKTIYPMWLSDRQGPAVGSVAAAHDLSGRFRTHWRTWDAPGESPSGCADDEVLGHFWP